MRATDSADGAGLADEVAEAAASPGAFERSQPRGVLPNANASKAAPKWRVLGEMAERIVESGFLLMIGPGGLAQPAALDWNRAGARPGGRWPSSVLLVALSLVSALNACGREESKAHHQKTAKGVPSLSLAQVASPVEREPLVSVGQAARRNAYTARITRIVECDGKEQSRPEVDQLFLGIELQVQAGALASVAIGHSHTRLLDGEGSHYSPMPLVRTQNCEPLFKYQRLAPKQTASGWLVFAIPARAHSLTLKLNPRRHLNESATVFRLGR